MSSSDKKTIKYRRPVHFNAGLLVFGAIFVYILFLVYAYLHTTHLTGYEVTAGSLAVNSSFRGVALRNETLVSANDAGYINYYAKESEHASRGGLVYSIDESGTLSQMIENSRMMGGSLAESDLRELRQELINFRVGYGDESFRHVYQAKDSLTGTVKKLANASALKNLESLSSNVAQNLINLGYAPQPGVVVYEYDGLEDVKPNDVDEDILDETRHEKNQLIDGRLVEDGEVAYKLISDENWSVVIALDEKTKASISENSYVKVRFLKNDYESWGKINVIEKDEGDFLELAFTNSMITFATDRYVDLELELDEISGLKVPNSAIVKKEFYLIPSDYLTTGLNDATGFIRRTYLEDGSDSTEFVAADVYNEVDARLYIDTAVLNAGDVLIRPDSVGEFTVSRKDSLTGVYNMNKGYADFTNIDIIDSNTEYSIVRSRSKYDLQVYDYIVLDGDGVNDNDFVINRDTGINL